MNEHIYDSFLEYHLDPDDPEIFVIGKKVCSDEDWFILEEVTSNGQFDGFSLYKAKDLVMTQDNTDYMNFVRALMFFRYDPPSVWPSFENNPFLNFLSYSKQIDKPIALELMESGEINARGFVSEMSDEYISLNQVNEFAHKDGKILISLRSITRAFIMNRKLEDIDLVYKKVNASVNRGAIT